MTTWPGPNRLQLQFAYQRPESWLRSHLHENNPIELLGPLARAKVPIFTIHGDSDRVVPFGSNGLASPSAADIYGLFGLEPILI